MFQAKPRCRGRSHLKVTAVPAAGLKDVLVELSLQAAPVARCGSLLWEPVVATGEEIRDLVVDIALVAIFRLVPARKGPFPVRDGMRQGLDQLCLPNVAPHKHPHRSSM
jgi:hypothetical protein